MARAPDLVEEAIVRRKRLEELKSLRGKIRLHIDIAASRRRLGVMEALPLLLPSASVWDAIETWLRRVVGLGQHFGVGDLLIAGIAAVCNGDATPALLCGNSMH